jgi:TolB-like protein
MTELFLDGQSIHMSLDNISLEIIDTMSNRKTLKVYQIRSILEYKGISVGYSEISTRLRLLSLLSIVEREKTSRVYVYRLSKKFEIK